MLSFFITPSKSLNSVSRHNKLIKDNLDELNLDENDKAEIQADIKIIETQVESPNPKKSIFKECLSSIRSIMEGAGGQIIAIHILEKLPVIEELVKSLF